MWASTLFHITVIVSSCTETAEATYNRILTPTTIMGTKRLTTHNPITTTLQTNEKIVEIEVPAGDHVFVIVPSSKLQTQEYIFHLRHPYSQLLLTGIVEIRGETAPCLKTQVIHHVPETKAETVIKTIVFSDAQPQYEGVITIEKQAQNSESYLNHHSLLLGTKAKSWTRPSLEIKANQVKCSHAATIRTLTDLDLFYIRSRGLSVGDARELLIEAFKAS